jgi:hypothetical protein
MEERMTFMKWCARRIDADTIRCWVRAGIRWLENNPDNSNYGISSGDCRVDIDRYGKTYTVSVSRIEICAWMKTPEEIIGNLGELGE